MARFRHIDYGKMLYETLRNYFSVNAQGQISLLYKYLACLIQPLVVPWTNYENQRILNGLVADTKWQIGQLTIVLNYIFDPVQKRIYIVQAHYTNVSDPTFAYNAKNFDDVFANSPRVFEREFADALSFQMLTFYVPSGTNISMLTAVIEQIRLQGITYKIVIIGSVS